MFINSVSSWVINKLKALGDIPVVTEYTIGLRYSYVIVEGGKGRSMGLAITPIEDTLGVKVGLSRKPKTEILLELVSSTNPLEKTLGVALLNALSSYLLYNVGYKGNIELYEGDIINAVTKLVEEPIIVIGNMVPLVRKLREVGFKDIVVTERNPCIRCGIALSDAATPRLIRKARTVIVTGATLVNDTIDYILSLTRGKAEVILVGPTAGLHPEPAFKNGVRAVASMTPIVIDRVAEVIRLGGGRWDYTRYCREYTALPKVK